jgi:hypothetical protein
MRYSLDNIAVTMEARDGQVMELNGFETQGPVRVSWPDSWLFSNPMRDQIRIILEDHSVDLIRIPADFSKLE